ncbi:hypothetical protein DEW08_28680 (plasmid) [Azospirillum thermophilum]|uniref:Uncharacterized protein n=1 Tax=Azospirillum thermophilum TaxID=2202148 RepID=A0A2S2CZP4_9PROT|nr:hypothetical protein DEW08_28680 [Azospirillum thermophilum]
MSKARGRDRGRLPRHRVRQPRRPAEPQARRRRRRRSKRPGDRPGLAGARRQPPAINPRRSPGPSYRCSSPCTSRR